MTLPEPTAIMAIGLVIFLAIGIHEYCHAKFADLAGDPTPRYYGRVTLNLTKHFEFLGTLMIVFTSLTGVGIGWGKPVPMDPSKMKNPKWDHFVAVAVGPFSNFAQAVLWGILFRLLYGGSDPGAIGEAMTGSLGFLPALLVYGVIINLSLCFFNLFPMGPLDGMWIVSTLMREPVRLSWIRFNLGFGSMLLLGLVLLGQLTGVGVLRAFIGPPLMFFARFFFGI